LSGGLGFRMRYFLADYSVRYTQALGVQHQASVSFRRPGTSKHEATTTP